MSQFLVLLLLPILCMKPVPSQDFSKIYIQNCYKTEQRAEQFPCQRFKTCTISLDWQDTTDYFEIRWIMTDLQSGENVSITYDYDMNNQFVLRPYTAKPGKYVISIYSILNGNIKHMKNKCYLVIPPQEPVAVISGGAKRTVRGWQEISAYGDESFDADATSDETFALSYKWTCSQKIATKNFCVKDFVSVDTVLTIPASYVAPMEDFHIILQVTSEAGVSSVVSQDVHVGKSDISELGVKCERNCPPVSKVSLAESPTLLYATCTVNCAEVTNDDFIWNVDVPNFDYDANTEFGRNSHRMLVKKDVLKPGVYRFEVSLKKGDSGHAAFIIDVKGPLKGISCEISPSKGVALTTWFKLMCNYPKDKVFIFDLYIKDETGDVIGSYYNPNVDKSLFQLPSTNHYLVKVTAEDGSKVILPVQVNVETVIPKDSDPDKIIQIMEEIYNKTSDNINNTVNDLSSTEERQKYVGILHLLVDEVIKIKSDDKDYNGFIHSLKFKIVNDLMKLPLSTLGETLVSAETIGKLMSYKPGDKMDPALAKFATTICKKMADKNLQLMQQERYPLDAGKTAQLITHQLTDCLNSNTNPNLDILEPVKVVNVTDVETLIDVPTVTENYEDYKDYDESHYKNLDDLQEAMYNIISATAKSAKVLAMSTAVGDKVVQHKRKKCQITVAKDLGSQLAQSKIQADSVTLVPSQDFAQSQHAFDILLCSWSHNLMWWDVKHTQIYTHIFYVQFWHSTCKEQVTEFQAPVHIYLDVKKGEEINGTTIFDNLTIAESYAGLSEKDLNYIIKVRRMGLKPHQGVLISFNNLEEGQLLDVVVTIMKYPTLEDFATNTTTVGISNNFSVVCRNEKTFDVWCYLGVLPNRNAVLNSHKGTKIWSYKLTLMLVSCARWIPSMKSWEPTCTLGKHTTESITHCECTHFSLLTALHGEITPKLIEVEPNIVLLKVEATYIIFALLLSTFIIYVLLSILVILRATNEIYYLADNNQEDLYAYLLIIRTGRWLASGTTSNVSIKLIGKKRTSAPHVLNYPDPELRMLQRGGEDWVVLTTSSYLGTLKRIDLWYDCIGQNPNWFCEDITIYDLQTQECFEFPIYTGFSLAKGIARRTVKLSRSKKGEMGVCSKLKFCDESHTWYLEDSNENFSYFKRLTVILSTITTAGALVLIMYGLPSLQPKDALDVFGYYNVGNHVWIIAISGSFASFLIHIVLSWVFRYSKIQFGQFEHQRVKFCFPVTVICWIILITLIVTSMSILIVFGFWVPYMTSYLWLTCVLFAIVVDILVYENVVVLLKNCFSKLESVQHDSKLISHIVTIVEKQRSILYRRFGKHLLRPYFQHLYTPLKRAEEKKIMEESRRIVILQLQDLFMFGIYILMLYLVVLTQRDSYTLMGRNEIETMMSGTSSRTFTFNQVHGENTFIHYLIQTLAPTLHSTIWYGDFVIVDPGMMIDQNNKFIGVARLRQQRVTRASCLILQDNKFVEQDCAPEFSVANQERGNYGHFWKNPTAYFSQDRLKTMWNFVPAKHEGPGRFSGIDASYSGEGYMMALGRTLMNSYANIRILTQYFWLNPYTRVVFIEFLVFNNNYNMFYAVTVAMEASATGYTSKTILVYPMRMVYVQNEMAGLNIVVFIMFVTWLCFLVIAKTLGIIRHFRTFYKDLWFLIDLVIIVLSIMCLTIYKIRQIQLVKYLEQVEIAKHNEFIDYFNLFYVGEVLDILCGILLCIATIRIWKLVRFGLIFRIMEKTLVIAAPWLLALGIFHLCLNLAFGFSGWMLFSNETAEFSTFTEIMTTLTIVSCSLYNYLNTDIFGRSTITIVYFVFLSSAMYLLDFFYIIIIMMSYVKAQEEFSTIIEVYSVQKYIQERVSYLPKYIKYQFYRLKGGEDVVNKPLITPKATEFRYANCLITNKYDLDMMHFVTQCVLRNRLQTEAQHQVLTEHDIYLMGRITRSILAGKADENEEIFYKGHFREQKLQIVSEDRIICMEKLAQLLLTKDIKQRRRTIPQNVQRCTKLLRRNLRTLSTCDLKLKLLHMKIIDCDL